MIALIAVFARGGPTQLDADTPEGVVQRYSQAVVDGDVPTALTYLVPEVADVVRTACRRAPMTCRLTLLETTERDDTARVRGARRHGVRIGSVRRRTSTRAKGSFDLVKVGGDWLIETAPWQLAVCEDSGVSR